MTNFGDYPGDFRLSSGHREKQFKIWSLPDYPGELTALALTLPENKSLLRSNVYVFSHTSNPAKLRLTEQLFFNPLAFMFFFSLKFCAAQEAQNACRRDINLTDPI